MNINIAKAENGYVLNYWMPLTPGVSSSTPMGGGEEKRFIFSTAAEAAAKAVELLEGGLR